MSTPDLLAAPPSAAPSRRGWPTADIARAALIVLAIWFGLQLLWSVSSLVLLVFLATLFGLAISRGVDGLARFGVRRGVGAALIVLGTLGGIGGVLGLSAPTLIQQGKVLQQEFPEAVHKLQTWLDSSQGGWVSTLITPAPDSTATPTADGTVPAPAQPSEMIRQRLAEGSKLATRYLFSFVSNTLAAITAFVLIVFLAMYLAAEPAVYRGWLLALVPAASRAEARHLLGAIAVVLRRWLVTQLIAMIVIGLVSMSVLFVLDVKAAFALGFLAGVLEFIPTVGPILSAIPAVLMGFTDSPEKAAAVAIAYWVIQFVENNLLIPYLMRGEMDLPPALTLVAQTLMTLVFGFLGLMVAVPLTAAVLVPIRLRAIREDAREAALRAATESAMPPSTAGPPPDAPPA
jgi:predicted PurR-regulated permease PerM